MPKDVINLHTIVKLWLKAHNFDGLYNSAECGCQLDNLMPCDNPMPDCEPGIKKEPDDYWKAEGADWIVGPKEED